MSDHPAAAVNPATLLRMNVEDKSISAVFARIRKIFPIFSDGGEARCPLRRYGKVVENPNERQIEERRAKVAPWISFLVDQIYLFGTPCGWTVISRIEGDRFSV